MPAVPVQDLHVPVGVGEDHQHGAEYLDAVRLAVQVILHRAKAMPATCIPVRQRAGVDLANACGIGGHPGPPNLCSLTRTRYSFCPPGRNLSGFTCGISRRCRCTHSRVDHRRSTQAPSLRPLPRWSATFTSRRARRCGSTRSSAPTSPRSSSAKAPTCRTAACCMRRRHTGRRRTWCDDRSWLCRSWVHIGAQAVLANHCTVLDGAVIGARSLIAAHSLVVGGTKIPDECW